MEARGTLGTILRQLVALQEGAPEVLRYGIRGKLSVRGWNEPLSFEEGGEIRVPATAVGSGSSKQPVNQGAKDPPGQAGQGRDDTAGGQSAVQ